jgi:hypothetical protein
MTLTLHVQDLAICVHGTTKVTPDQYLYTNAFMDKISGVQCCAQDCSGQGNCRLSHLVDSGHAC